MRRRQGRPGSKLPLCQVSSNFPGSANEEQSAFLFSSSSDKFSKPRVLKSINSRRQVVADENISINKEPTFKALIALTARFSSESLTTDGSEIRNYMLSYGYINFGVALAIKDKIPVEPKKGEETVVGAGLTGLAVVRQLMLFGFEFAVLEGRNYVGGRLSYTLHKVRDQCPLYRANGNPIDEYLDTKVEVAYNSLLNKASKLKQEVFSGLEAQIHNHYPVV
ncbi:hypothetical protein H5410_049563 [Solanum commersonii]|uniref:Amine oxidase domain-containing protein n=1 Tax=Solanum commersonii TaxID=4109 RepID=A0A9J5WVD2_SOLCO|nr:hypothetical protein H5410_049563 [Solanum commersonii]